MFVFKNEQKLLKFLDYIEVFGQLRSQRNKDNFEKF